MPSGTYRPAGRAGLLPVWIDGILGDLRHGRDRECAGDGITSELVVVARGKTIQAPEGIYKPGDSIELPHDEVLRLISLGVVRRPGESVMTVDHWGPPRSA
jgi:hypothetical protein